MSFKSRLYALTYHPFFLPALLTVIALGIALQNYFMGDNYFWEGKYTFYNNYVIFKNAFFHLTGNQNLYARYMQEYGDLYKYSPTFALFMGVFAYLPVLAGLFLWNFFNCLVFYLAIKTLRLPDRKSALFIFVFVLPELVLSTQSSQSNLLIAGLLILAFNKLENNKPGTAAGLIAAGVFIKLFALLGILLFLFYPKKLQFILYGLLWAAVLLLAPLVVVSPQALLEQYNNWFFLLDNDHISSFGMSVYSIVAALAGSVNKTGMLIAGILFLLLPLLNYRRYGDYSFRAVYMSAVLIWIVIFNYRAESPTYVIAMAGCAIWAALTVPSLPLKIILALTFVFTSLIKTDLVPRSIKNNLDMNVIGAVMPALVFLVIIFSLMKPTEIFRYKTIGPGTSN